MAMESKGTDEIVALERVEFSDSDDDFKYDAVSEGDSEPDSDDEDLDHALRSLRTRELGAARATVSSAPSATTKEHPPVVDDFIRNFLIKAGLTRTLDVFNTEWYEARGKGTLDGTSLDVPDVYAHNARQDDEVRRLKAELKRQEGVAQAAQSTWDKFRKERDFHRMHHKRVMHEKNSLVADIRRLRKKYDKFDPVMQELHRKYELAMKEKMLMRLERDRIASRVSALELQVKSYEDAARGAAKAEPEETKRATRRPKGADSVIPKEDAVNPFLGKSFDPPPVGEFQLTKTYKCHNAAVSNVAMHPSKPIVATVSDDRTWKLWTVPDGELIMSGDGHKEWVVGVDFHPGGNLLATSSGDGLVKLWDFASASCAATYGDHTQSAWSVAFHYTGDFVASGSMDHTAKLWDINSHKCRQTFRGHVDSVNCVAFQPFSSNLCTASGDKSLSIWDSRAGLCVQSLFGHQNAVNHLAFNLQGDTIVSCDADGVIKIFDVRMVAERDTIETGQDAVNKVSLDRSGTLIAAATDKGIVHVFNSDTLARAQTLRGHEDAVQAAVFEQDGKFMLTAGSDKTMRIWSRPGFA